MKKWISYILASSLLFTAVPPFMVSAAESSAIEAETTNSSEDPNGKLTVKKNDVTVTLTIPQTISNEITSLRFQLKVSIEDGGMDEPTFTFKSASTSSIQDVSVKEQDDTYIVDIIISGKKDQFIFPDNIESVDIGTLSLCPTTEEFKAKVEIVSEAIDDGTGTNDETTDDGTGTNDETTDDGTESDIKEIIKKEPVVRYVTSNGQSVQKVFLKDTESAFVPAPDLPSTSEDSTTSENPGSSENPTTPENPSTPSNPTTPENPSTPNNPSTPSNPSTPGGSFDGSSGSVLTPTPEEPDTTENTTPPTVDTPNNTPTDSNTVTTPPTSTEPEPDTNSDKTIEVGEKVNVGSAEYEIISSNDGKKEVAYLNTTKKKKSVTIPSTITIDDVVYTVTEIADRAFAGNTKLTSVSIPATVTKIGNSSFRNCKKLTKIAIPKKVKTIGKQAFFGCKSAVSLTFKGNKVIKIGQKAFMNNTKIKKVSIPTSVKRINKNAFNGCKSLKTVIIPSKQITVIGNHSFKGISKKATIKVPAAKVKRYTKLLRNSGYKGKIKKI